MTLQEGGEEQNNLMPTWLLNPNLCFTLANPTYIIYFLLEMLIRSHPATGTGVIVSTWSSIIRQCPAIGGRCHGRRRLHILMRPPPTLLHLLASAQRHPLLCPWVGLLTNRLFAKGIPFRTLSVGKWMPTLLQIS